MLLKKAFILSKGLQIYEINLRASYNVVKNLCKIIKMLLQLYDKSVLICYIALKH